MIFRLLRFSAWTLSTVGLLAMDPEPLEAPLPIQALVSGVSGEPFLDDDPFSLYPAGPEEPALLLELPAGPAAPQEQPAAALGSAPALGSASASAAAPAPGPGALLAQEAALSVQNEPDPDQENQPPQATLVEAFRKFCSPLRGVPLSTIGPVGYGLPSAITLTLVDCAENRADEVLVFTEQGQAFLNLEGQRHFRVEAGQYCILAVRTPQDGPPPPRFLHIAANHGSFGVMAFNFATLSPATPPMLWVIPPTRESVAKGRLAEATRTWATPPPGQKKVGAERWLERRSRVLQEAVQGLAGPAL